MTTRSRAQSLTVLTLLFAAACGSSTPPTDKPTTPATNTTAATSTADAAKDAPPAASNQPKRGLDAPDNDPALVALARQVLTCFRKAECPPQGKWYEPFHIGKQVDFKTLVNFLEDDHPEIRTIAAGVLRGKKGQPGFHNDVAYATRVLDALDREKEEHVARDIALAAGFIDVKATGLEERMFKFIRSDKPERARIAMVESILDNNYDVPSVVAGIKALVKDDKSGDMRAAAVEAFGDVSELRAEACPYWAGLLGDEDRYVVRKCFYQMISHFCAAQFDTMMTAAEKRPPDGIENFQQLCRFADTPAPVKKRLITDLETWALNTTLSGSQRVEALRVLVMCDAAKGKKTASAMTTDKEDYVRESATEVVKTTPKP